MRILGPTRFHRLNEAGGLVFLFAGIFFVLCLISYHPQDPSWNSVTGAAHAHNLTGLAGSYTADLCFQLLGLSAFSLPVLLWMLAWKWIRSDHYSSRHGESDWRDCAVPQHLHRALHPSLLAALERSFFGGWRGWHFDRRFAAVIAQSAGHGAAHRHLPDPLAVPDLKILHGDRRQMARGTAELLGRNL